MSPQLEAFIRDLSMRDKKSLTQKVLKIGEEYGELCDRVLAFEEAPQHLHKIATESEVDEESVDIILTAASVLLSRGRSWDDIYSLMLTKANKWQGLQDQEKHDKFMFEIHLYYRLSEHGIEHFKTTCIKVGVKAIIIDNNSPTDQSRDVMTSSRVYGSFKDAENKAKLVALQMEEWVSQESPQFKGPIRKKIEVATNHPLANLSTSEMRIQGMYFESHMQVFIKDDAEHEVLLKIMDNNKEVRFLRNCRAHFSRNPFKKLGTGYVQMVNFRTIIEKDEFVDGIDEVYQYLLMHNFQVLEKPELELCVLDDNTDQKKF